MEETECLVATSLLWLEPDITFQFSVNRIAFGVVIRSSGCIYVSRKQRCCFLLFLSYQDLRVRGFLVRIPLQVLQLLFLNRQRFKAV